MSFAFFFLGVLTLFILLDVLQKKVLTTFQWSRKATHIFTGVVIYFMPVYLTRNEISLMALIFIVMLAVSKWKTILSLHNVERKTLGEVFYPISIAILALLCLPANPRIFQISILVLALSDGLAGLVGEIWDFRPIKMFQNKKSVGGSICFFVVTCFIFLAFHGFSSSTVPIILLAAFSLTIAEFILFYGFDNLALPILTAGIEFIFFT